MFLLLMILHSSYISSTIGHKFWLHILKSPRLLIAILHVCTLQGNAYFKFNSWFSFNDYANFMGMGWTDERAELR